MGETVIHRKENNLLAVIWVLSVAIPVAVAFLLFSPVGIIATGSWVYSLPHINGLINSLTAITLIAGVISVKKRKINLHKAFMIASFVLGSIFLVSYVVYHASVTSTSYGGEGAIRYVYFFLLISHIVLAIVVVPFVLLAVFYAFTNRIAKHQKIVKYTFPIWLYVSVTGVIVYLMISPYYNH